MTSDKQGFGLAMYLILNNLYRNIYYATSFVDISSPQCVRPLGRSVQQSIGRAPFPGARRPYLLRFARVTLWGGYVIPHLIVLITKLYATQQFKEKL
jgi:hypothetical protein